MHTYFFLLTKLERLSLPVPMNNKSKKTRIYMTIIEATEPIIYNIDVVS